MTSSGAGFSGCGATRSGRAAPGTVDAGHITQLLVFVSKPAEDHVFEIQDVRAAGAYTPPTAWVTDAQPYFPFIDTFGSTGTRTGPAK